MTSRALILALLLFIGSVSVTLPVEAGLLAYGLCQTGCNTLAGACYAAAGAIFGVTAGFGAPPAVVACNVGLGICMANCALVCLAPTP